MSDSSASTSVPSPEPSPLVVMRNDAVSGLKVAPLMEGMDSTIVDLLLVTSSSVSVTTDIMEAKLGDTVVELVSVSTEIEETDGSPVIDGTFVLSVSRLSVIPGDIAVGASVLKREDVPVTEEVGVSGVWSPEPISSTGVKMELCSVSSGMDSTIVDLLLVTSSSVSVTTDIMEAKLGDTVVELVSVSTEIEETDGSPVIDGTFVLSVSRLSVIPGDIAVGASVLKREDVPVTEEVGVSGVWSPEPISSTGVKMELCSVSSGMDSTIVDLLLVTSSSVSVTTDIMEAKLGDTVVELVSVSTEIEETDGSPVIDGTFVLSVSRLSVIPGDIAVGASVLKREDVPVTEEVGVSGVWSPEPISSTGVKMELCSVSSGMDSTIVDLLLVTSSSVSVTTDIMEAKLGDTVVELVSVSTEIEETDGSPVIDGTFVLSVSRLSVIPGDIAVGASVLKREDVPVTEEVGVSGVWSPEPISSTGVKMELCSVSSVMDDTEDLSV
uniref:uncharacterized protein LOC117252476 n=1 Tax=Epinephelus lanceolatus TaxID=310571 RepID=UPI001445AC2D|nr:uncharacterized protein LOC117252476 [Epinephelus lanceolatus]